MYVYTPLVSASVRPWVVDWTIHSGWKIEYVCSVHTNALLFFLVGSVHLSSCIHINRDVCVCSGSRRDEIISHAFNIYMANDSEFNDDLSCLHICSIMCSACSYCTSIVAWIARHAYAATYTLVSALLISCQTNGTACAWSVCSCTRWRICSAAATAYVSECKSINDATPFAI